MANPALRLDIPREEAIARAADLIAEAWRSFDRFRPGQPTIGHRVRELTALGLSERERADLVAFLQALDGPGPSAALREEPR